MQVNTIDDVLGQMDEINASLPPEDGVATFNRMYRAVTQLVRSKIVDADFQNLEFLDRLDVHFANLYLAAYDADQAGEPIPKAWAPLFEARARANTHPIQFAFAGMNAHISHDLAHAVVHTYDELALTPGDDTAEHGDYTHTNDVLDEATPEIKLWFSNGIVAVLDDAGGRVDDGFAMFGIHTARAVAWETFEWLWRLRDNPRLDAVYRAGLARSVAFASRAILL